MQQTSNTFVLSILLLLNVNNTSNERQVSRNFNSQLLKKQLRTATSKCHSKRSVCHSKESVCNLSNFAFFVIPCKNMCV